MSQVPYIDLTELTTAERERRFREESRRGVTYITEGGEEVSSESIQRVVSRPPLERPWPRHGEPAVIVERRDAGAAPRGRPTPASREKRIRAMYDDWVVEAIEREMGRGCGQVTPEEFESCLVAVAREKGWTIR